MGWAHIGVLQQLQEDGVAVGAAAGTSIGALAAVCFAANRLEQLEKIARSANWLRVLSYLDFHLRPGAMLGGRGILRDLNLHLGNLQFRDLWIPSAVATDLVTGKPVIIDHGPVSSAVMASIAIPGLFRPVQYDGHFMVDGGVVMPVPVAAARQIAPKLPVLSVNLQGDYHGRRVATAIRSAPKRAHNSMAVVRASTMLLMAELARHSLALDPPDFALTLPVGHVEIHDFTKADELIAIGRRSVRENIEDIRAMAGKVPLKTRR